MFDVEVVKLVEPTVGLAKSTMDRLVPVVPVEDGKSIWLPDSMFENGEFTGGPL